jgi:hypothetical protein
MRQKEIVTDLGAGGTSVAHDLGNMLGALARRHGQQTALALMAEGFAQFYAANTGCNPVPARFALETALNRAEGITRAAWAALGAGGLR